MALTPEEAKARYHETVEAFDRAIMWTDLIIAEMAACEAILAPLGQDKATKYMRHLQAENKRVRGEYVRIRAILAKHDKKGK